jgi:hypothetical protein
MREQINFKINVQTRDLLERLQAELTDPATGRRPSMTEICLRGLACLAEQHNVVRSKDNGLSAQA